MIKEKYTTKKVEVIEKDYVFGKENYTLMIAGVAVIFIGFVLMSGQEDIFDFRKITLAPIVVLAGFVIEVFAIMRKPKD
ncbi:MAG: DUF3098 domain-containing protein [Bacteroidia bacterium]|nr:DUF3098 domain-containing protein [Bacteroidia bacterium]